MREPHQHIDSSGVFDCPVPSQCKSATAGEVFDGMLVALEDVAEWLQTGMVNDVYYDQASVLVSIRAAIADAKGKTIGKNGRVTLTSES